MPENPGTQLAPMEQVRGLILTNQRALTNSLPSHLKEQGAAFLNAAVAAVQRDDKLISAVMTSPQTFVNALSEAAQYGLKPGTPEYYLTPRKNKGRMEVLGIMGYQGEIELIYRAGAVSSVIAEVVYENDFYKYERGEDLKPVHRIPGGNFGARKDRGKLIGVYAYGIMADGSYSRIIEHGADHIEDVKRSSQGSDGDYSPWKKWPDQMWLKTAVHSLSKWVPTSAEYARQAATLAVTPAVTVPGAVVPEQKPADQRPAPADLSQPNPAQQQTQQGPPSEPQRPAWTPPEPQGEYEDMGEQGTVNTGTGEFTDDPTAAAWGLGDTQK